jgi:endonuclease G, mitochondrial
MAYNQAFIAGYQIPFPNILPTDNHPGGPLEYCHHSIIMNPLRRFAYVSASNTDGNSWKPIERKGGFKKDEQLDASFQLGGELYQAISGGAGKKNDFDEGHLTSFQEVLWGEKKESKRAGADTFYYTNCVPQHGSLNRGAWRSLEQYLVKKAADPNELRITVMTGPVLLSDDPFFINVVDGEVIRIPCAFWKVIYYKGAQGLQAVGFMMSHLGLLLRDETISYNPGAITDRGEAPGDVFMMFPKATTYQVSVSFIENITGMSFYKHGVTFPYKLSDSREVIYKRIDVPAPRGMAEEVPEMQDIGFELSNIVL